MSGTFSSPYAPAMTLIAPLAGITTVWADQNAPRPIKPYLALKVMSRKSRQNDEYGPVQADGTQAVISDVDLTLEIQAYGDGAQDILETLTSQLGFQSVTIICATLGMAIRSRGTVMNITQLLDRASFEDRASVEITIGYRESAVDTVGIIDQVSGSGTGVIGNRAVPTTFLGTAFSNAPSGVWDNADWDGADYG